MNFYKVLIDEGKRKKFAEGILIDENQPQKVQCNSCTRVWTKEPLLENDVLINIALTNNNYPDFMYLLYNILVSENVKNVIDIENITGCQLKKINILSKNNISSLKITQLKDDGYKIKNIPDTPPVYYRLIVNRSAQLHTKSNVILREKCEVCGYERYEKIGDIFDKEFIKRESWNGDDLFMVKEFSAVVYCTERFVEVYKKYNLTGLKFQEIDSL